MAKGKGLNCPYRPTTLSPEDGGTVGGATDSK